MTTTVGLELTNFLNPDLTWKTVAKGNRSAARRHRKPVAKFLAAGVELADKSPRTAEDSAVSDSEKLGVAVLGRRFSDKMEHVPIKKRKYIFRSPSPPPRTPSPHSKVSQHALGQGSCPNSSGSIVHMAGDASTASSVSLHFIEGKAAEAMNVKLDFREDFSGIEMLADAACSDSFDVNVDHTVEKPVAEESAYRENDCPMLKEEIGGSLETNNSSSKGMLVEDRLEESSCQDTTPDVEQKSPSLEDNEMVESSVSMCNERIYWDLNVQMDDWHQPCDVVNIETNTADGNAIDKTGKLNILEGGEKDDGTGEIDVVKDDVTVGKLVSSEACEKADCHFDTRGTSGENRQDNQLEAIKVDGEGFGRVSSSLHNDISAPQEVSSIDNYQPPNVVPVTVEPVCKVEEVGVSHVSLMCEDVSTSGAPIEVQPVVTVENCPLAAEALPSHTGGVNSSVHLVGSKDDIYVNSGNHTATVETTSTTHEDCIDYGAVKSLGEVNNEDPNDKICESETAQDDKGHMIGMENSRELQAGYDSQFEDGELRETDVHCWDEREGNSEEIEQVDYESECDGERMCIPEAEGSENKTKYENVSSRGCDVAEKIEECASGDASRDYSISSTMINLEATDGSKLKKDTVDCVDGHDGKDFSSHIVGSREYKELLSHTEGSYFSDTIQRSGSDNDPFPRLEREAASKSMERDRYRVRGQYLSSSSNSVYRPFNRRSLACRDDINGTHGGTAPVRDGNNADGSRFRRYPQGVGRDIREDYQRPMSNYSSDHMPHRFARRERSSSPVGGGRLNYNQPYKKSRSRSKSRSPTSRLLRERNEGSRRRSRSPNFRSVRMDRVSLPFLKRFTADFEEGFMSPPRNRLSPHDNSQFEEDNFRSPNFRSVRMDRVRMPSQKHFTVGYEEGFISPPRKRFSAQHNSQFVERISTTDNFRSSNFRSFRGDKVRLPFQKHCTAEDEGGFISPPRKRQPPQDNSQFEDRISALDNFRSPNLRSVRMERVRMPFQKHFAAGYEEGFISRPRKRFSPQQNSQFDERISTLDNFRSSNFRSFRGDRMRLPFQKHFTAEDEEGYVSPPRKRFSPQNNSRFDDLRDRKSPVRNFRQGQRFDSVRSIRPIGQHPRRFQDMGGAGRGGYKSEGGEDDKRKQGGKFEMSPRLRRYEDTDGAVQRMTTEDE